MDNNTQNFSELIQKLNSTIQAINANIDNYDDIILIYPMLPLDSFKRLDRFSLETKSFADSESAI